ncbi:Uncharacterised protein [Legionella beliardensis]|uniref:Uncharacterized protein n=1 Tax=Legionella beliardensis TaxID=91822 RepID=A0A378HZL4_9GAMM|nr:hypothetical protein [Legionella beliardensis]STX27951.1 Uncharacterised protein [Legionella beliardensis]
MEDSRTISARLAADLSLSEYPKLSPPDEQKALFIFKESCKEYESTIKINLVKELEKLNENELRQVYGALVRAKLISEQIPEQKEQLLSALRQFMESPFPDKYRDILISRDNKLTKDAVNVLLGMKKLGLVQSFQEKTTTEDFLSHLDDEQNKKILFAKRDSSLTRFFKKIVVGISFLATLPIYGIGGLLAHELLIEKNVTKSLGEKLHDRIQMHRKNIEKESLMREKEFSSQCLIVRVGDHVFLRNVYDLYEGLASKHTTQDNKRGIVQLFPADDSLIAKKIAANPHDDFDTIGEDTLVVNESSTAMEEFGQIAMYYKDKDSIEAINTNISDNTRLKIYVAGHCDYGSTTLQSLEVGGRTFNIDYKDIAQALDNIFARKFPDGKAKNVEISLIACHAGAKSHKGEPAFAELLLQELAEKGHDVIIKASTEPRAAPIPFISKTVEHSKKLFTQFKESMITSDDIGKNWVYNVLKSLRNYQTKYKGLSEEQKTKLKEIITFIQEKKPYNDEGLKEELKDKLSDLLSRKYSSRKNEGGLFERNIKSDLEKDLDKLIKEYATEKDEIKNKGPLHNTGL